MILVRDVFQLKFGKARQALEIARRMKQVAASANFDAGRMMTDLTGPYYTLVFESTYDDVAAWHKELQESFKSDEWAAIYSEMVPLMESGHREIYTIIE